MSDNIPQIAKITLFNMILGLQDDRYTKLTCGMLKFSRLGIFTLLT